MSAEACQPSSGCLKLGDVFDNRFCLKRVLAHSAVGTVFACLDIKTQKPVALKVGHTKLAAACAQNEAKMLIHAFGHDVKRTPRLITCKQEASHSYVVQKLLGKSIYSKFKSSEGINHATLRESVKLVLGMSLCLRDVHNAGIVHRNIKPGNFSFGRQSTQLYLIDFGIARLFMADDGSVIPPRRNPGFRGSVQYASINAHLNQELSPRDDYWSMVFSVLELLNGSLPWSGVNDKQAVMKMKEALIRGDSLPAIYPPYIDQIMKYLATVKYGELVCHCRIKMILKEATRTPEFQAEAHDTCAFSDIDMSCCPTPAAVDTTSSFLSAMSLSNGYSTSFSGR
ncbi:Protein kinase domain [Carpediemonas membranifera]|uniref:Protein kinase domain n=1 Tax=Carpediemonas membranifera TaxID=201153 RepID=A0A8J6B739_9EUKA|nr:Protein kinase domain [Carpediemonas membranifera]|eukprot:KAG9391347.1 Protein kinase domain [Carpediemonas membranifera]